VARSAGNPAGSASKIVGGRPFPVPIYREGTERNSLSAKTTDLLKHRTERRGHRCLPCAWRGHTSTRGRTYVKYLARPQRRERNRKSCSNLVARYDSFLTPTMRHILLRRAWLMIEADQREAGKRHFGMIAPSSSMQGSIIYVADIFCVRVPTESTARTVLLVPKYGNSCFHIVGQPAPPLVSAPQLSVRPRV
jgi:hypothetical protein